eukprot:jgi/Phyca11/552887/estExt2_Genewise1Plus.C_PHYCAscaffold_500015
MGLFYLVCVAILAFMAGDSTGDRVIVSDGFNQHRENAARASVVSTTRLLRTKSVIDEERVGGIPVSATDKLAKFLKPSKVTDKQLQEWLRNGKTAESVFYRMNLNNPSTKYLFEDLQFTRWLKYADDLSASGKGASAISVLSAKYGDEILYLMIDRAMQEQSKALGIRLQADQLAHWVKVRKDPDEVFKLYDLNYAGRGILSNSQFNAWTKYVDDLSAKNEGAFVSIIPTLRKYYSDDNLIKIALAAKEVDETEAMGMKLEDAFVQFWIHRKETPDNVLVDLGLKKSTKTLLKNPLLNILTKYTEAYNVNYPSMRTTVIETLTRTFSDEVMAKTFLAGRTEYTTKKIAKQFQTDQLEMWLSSGQSVDDVYKLLSLPPRNSLVDFGNQKLFDTWLTFMNAVSIKNPDKTSAIFTTLAPTFNDRPMMQILEAAKKFPSMEKAATKLQLEKAQSIFSTGVSPYTAFRMVALDDVGESVLSSPLFKKWMLRPDRYHLMAHSHLCCRPAAQHFLKRPRRRDVCGGNSCVLPRYVRGRGVAGVALLCRKPNELQLLLLSTTDC